MWSIYPSAGTTSVIYNSDGTGVPLTQGTYQLAVIAFDRSTTGRTDNNTTAITHFTVE